MIFSLLHLLSPSFSYANQNIRKYPFLFVGGIVRDYILYLLTQDIIPQKISHSVFLLPMQGFDQFIQYAHDIDVATSFNPKEAGAVLDHTFPNSKRIRRFATHTIYGEVKIDCTSTRIDTQCDGRHAKMKFGVSYYQDSFRRDFTFNAMYLSSNGILFDFHNGVEHLNDKKIYFIGDAKTRISEDYTRIKRYYNFAKRLNLRNKEIEKEIDYIIANSKTPIAMR